MFMSNRLLSLLSDSQFGRLVTRSHHTGRFESGEDTDEIREPLEDLIVNHINLSMFWLFLSHGFSRFEMNTDKKKKTRVDVHKDIS